VNSKVAGTFMILIHATQTQIVNGTLAMIGAGASSLGVGHLMTQMRQCAKQLQALFMD